MCRILCIGFLISLVLLTGEVSYAQKINLKFKNAPFKDIIRSIEKQTNISFVTDGSISQSKTTITINVKNKPLTEVLDALCRQQPYEYMLIGDLCSIRRKVGCLKGKVINELGEPLQGVTISLNHEPALITDSVGEFSVEGITPGAVLSFSYVGHESKRIIYQGEPNVQIPLTISSDHLNVVTQKGYISQLHLVTRINSKEVQRIVEPNLHSLFLGRIPGLLVTPGNSSRIQLRGQSTIGVVPGKLPPSDPMLFIDGIPFAANSNSVQTGVPINALGVQGNSPFVNINPDDIETIVVLKDADATVLYGSQGANGIILINTKKGKQGKPVPDIKAWSGAGQITRAPELLNTQQYMQMRREAFENANTTPTSLLAPDLTLWDTIRYTDFRKQLIEGTALRHNLQTAISGGSYQTHYYFSGSYFHETTAFPGDMGFNRKSLHGHLTHTSHNSRFSADVVSILGASKNNWINEDITTLYLPPNIPPSYEAARDINTNLGYTTHTFNSMSRGQLKYRPSTDLQCTVTLGYNRMKVHENGLFPISSQLLSAVLPATGTAYTAKNLYSSWVAEPQLLYTRYIKQIKFTWLLGTSIQQISNTVATTLHNDSFLINTNAARSVDYTTNSKYNYIGNFSRFGFRFWNKYFMNITVRRDWSGRLSADNRFGNFGAVGAAWIFSNESFFKKSLPFISYGKIRSIYGITGDDEVAENNYSDSWPRFSNFKQGSAATIPIRITDAHYSWQISRKLELGIDLGFLNDHVFLSVAAYRNRVGKQVIGYGDPTMGLNAVMVRNSNAIVQNKGLEVMLQVKNNETSAWQWNSKLALTIPNNKLLAFPGLSNSPYAGTLVVGKSLSVQQGYQFTGVNSVTGLFEVADLNGDGQITRDDYTVMGDLDPKLYGSLELGLNYKNWELNVFLEGRVQKGYSLLYQVYAHATPGADMVNVPVDFLNRWRQPGDQSNIQRVSAKGDIQANKAIFNFLESDARLTPASYIRVRTVYLSYNLPVDKIAHQFFKTLRFYLSAGNLFTITKYNGTDPVTQNMYALPTLQTLVTGLQFSL